jgi:Domain of unknown function (DUF5666)
LLLSLAKQVIGHSLNDFVLGKLMCIKLKDLAVKRRPRDFTRYGLALALVVILAVLMPACSSTPAASPTTPSTPDSTQRPGAFGSLTKIDGNTLTLTTAQGQVTVYVGSDTSIQKTTTGTLSDLHEGQSLTVTGNQDASGNITATSIMVQPQGQSALFTPRAGATPNTGGTGGRPSEGTYPAFPGGGTGGNPSEGTYPTFPSGGIGRGATGSLTKIDGNTLTLTTAQGQVTVYVGSDTTIQKNISGTLSDLHEGQSLTVMGNQDASGNITATSIIIRPAATLGPTPAATPSPAPTTTPSPTPGTEQVNIGIYSNADCTKDVLSIDWGSLKSGATSVTKKVYVKDLSNQVMTVTVSVPSAVTAAGITFPNSGPLSLTASSLRPGVWVLTMSLVVSGTAESGDLNFNIIFTGVGPAVPQFTMNIPSHVSIVAPQ